MSRAARLVIPDVSVHIVQRGHDRAACFFDDADYFAYLDALRSYAPQMRCSVHAYCLMTNHVHLLVTPHVATSCAQLMKHLAQGHSRRINGKLGRSGTLWEGRFYSAVVPTEAYALACYRYIELNPVHAGMVERPAQYRWSSYQRNAAFTSDGLVSPHAAYMALAADANRRATVYAGLCDVSLEETVVEDIRKATRGGYAVGAKPRPRGRPKMKMVTVTI